MLGECTIDCCDTPVGPEQIRLSVTSDPCEMVVTWSTLELTPQPVVIYGHSVSNLNLTVPAKGKTYDKGGWRGKVYTATLKGLLPGRFRSRVPLNTSRYAPKREGRCHVFRQITFKLTISPLNFYRNNLSLQRGGRNH